MYFNAVTLYRAARWARDHRIPILPGICKMLMHVLFNTYIGLNAEIGPGTYCAHRGIGVVVGDHARLGSNCLIRAHVVIGSSDRGKGKQPVIGDRVELGVGAKVLGDISVGDDAVIGANAVVLHDVVARGVAVGIPAKTVSVRAVQD